jgi:hypothetical protein
MLLFSRFRPLPVHPLLFNFPHSWLYIILFTRYYATHTHRSLTVYLTFRDACI